MMETGEFLGQRPAKVTGRAVHLPLRAFETATLCIHW